MWDLVIIFCFQVYQARLRPNGLLVAVKVQRPGVRPAMALDLFILRKMAGFVKSLLKLNTDLPVKSLFFSLFNLLVMRYVIGLCSLHLRLLLAIMRLYLQGDVTYYRA